MSGSGGFFTFLGRPKKDKLTKNRRRAISAEDLNRPFEYTADDIQQIHTSENPENSQNPQVTIKKERMSLPKNLRKSLTFQTLNQSLSEENLNDSQNRFSSENARAPSPNSVTQNNSSQLSNNNNNSIRNNGNINRNGNASNQFLPVNRNEEELAAWTLGESESQEEAPARRRAAFSQQEGESQEWRRWVSDETNADFIQKQEAATNVWSLSQQNSVPSVPSAPSLRPAHHGEATPAQNQGNLDYFAKNGRRDQRVDAEETAMKTVTNSVEQMKITSPSNNHTRKIATGNGVDDIENVKTPRKFTVNNEQIFNSHMLFSYKDGDTYKLKDFKNQKAAMLPIGGFVYDDDFVFTSFSEFRDESDNFLLSKVGDLVSQIMPDGTGHFLGM